MRLLLLLLATLTATLSPDSDLSFRVQTDVQRTFYVQIDTAGGAQNPGPSIYQFTLAPGESFARTQTIVQGLTPGTVRVRVWDGGEGPSDDQTFPVPARGGVQRTYLPMLIH